MRRFVWPAIFTALALVLVIAVWPQSSAPRDNDARVAHLAAQVRCPTCSGLSVGESNAPLAQSARDEIASQVSAGKSDKEIRAYFISRYGNNALMTPARHGVAATAWVLPMVVALILLVGVVVAVRRWQRPVSKTSISEADRALVADALAGRS